MTTPHDRFVEPARAYPQLWRLVLGILLIIAIIPVSVIAVFAIGWFLFGAEGESILDWATRVGGAGDAEGTMMLLFAFVGLFVGPMAAARVFHRRKPRTLFGPRVRTFRDFILAFITVGCLMLLSALLWSLSYDAVPNLDPAIWLKLLPLTVLGLLIQTGAEELAFRGYLQQQLAARFRATWVWLFVPSLAFGLVHYNPELQAETAWLVVGAATAFGLVAADLTARTGSLGAAWGFHFANNMFAIAFLSTQGTITGLSLFKTPYSIEQTGQIDILILVDLAFLVLAWWLVRRIVSR